MHFIYRGSHNPLRGIHRFYKAGTTCTGWITYAKIKISRPQYSTYPTFPHVITTCVISHTLTAVLRDTNGKSQVQVFILPIKTLLMTSIMIERRVSSEAGLPYK